MAKKKLKLKKKNVKIRAPVLDFSARNQQTLLSKVENQNLPFPETVPSTDSAHTEQGGKDLKLKTEKNMNYEEYGEPPPSLTQ